MAYTTFSQTKNDQLKKSPILLFGQPVNVARYDQQRVSTSSKS